jgi:hypothetical protein
MSRKPEPVAEIGADDYLIVRHTHDVQLATKLMRAKLAASWDGCPAWESSVTTKGVDYVRLSHPCTEKCLESINPGTPRQAWIRVIPCLDNSFGAAEGWEFEYRDAEPHSRGAFPAVVFT